MPFNNYSLYDEFVNFYQLKEQENLYINPHGMMTLMIMFNILRLSDEIHYGNGTINKESSKIHQYTQELISLCA